MSNQKRVCMKRIAVFILCSLLTLSLAAFKNIETSKKKIAATLQKNNPTALAKFNQFCLQYDQSVITFFDTNNNLSLADHIKHMEKDLATLNYTHLRAHETDSYLVCRLL